MPLATQEQPERAREITLAAIEAIHERGLDRVKLTDVARHAQLTTGAVTYYFEDKDALLLAAFRQVGRQLFDAMRAFEGGWHVDRFLNSLPTTAARRRQWSVWLAFCGRAQGAEALNRVYRAFYEDIETELATLTGLDGEQEARERAADVIAAVDGVGLCATLHPDAWPTERQRQALKVLLAPHFPDTDTGGSEA